MRGNLAIEERGAMGTFINERAITALALLAAACAVDGERDQGGGGLTGSGWTQPACGTGWGVDAVVHEGGPQTIAALLALREGFMAGGPGEGVLARRGPSGGALWHTDVQGQVTDVAPGPEGGVVVATQVADVRQPSGKGVRVAAVAGDGRSLWETDLGGAHHDAWMDADVLAHPQGGWVVSWHASRDASLAPSAMLARIDAGGALRWRTGQPLEAGSSVGINWSQGAVALLADGTAVQLTAGGVGLRLLHTGTDGRLLADAHVGQVVAWPKDLVVLPEGTLLVLANTAEAALLLEVALDGRVLAERPLALGAAGFADALAWDPVEAALYVGGTARDARGVERPVTLVTDRDGGVLHHQQGAASAGAVTSVLDVSVLPTGGFLVSRHGSGAYCEAVMPCAGP